MYCGKPQRRYFKARRERRNWTELNWQMGEFSLVQTRFSYIALYNPPFYVRSICRVTEMQCHVTDTVIRHFAWTLISYLRQGGYVFAGFCLFICLSVCVYKITQKVMDGFFWNFWGYVGHGISWLKWLNFGGWSGRNFGLLWNFRYHCVKAGISGTAAKPKMVTTPGE